MQVSDLVTQAITFLSSYVAAVATHSIDATQDVAAKALADLVAERLRRDGNGGAWDAFVRAPQDVSVLQYLLAQAVGSDQSFRVQFDQAALRAISAGSRATRQAVSATGPAGNQIGDNVAIGQGTYHKGDVNTHNRTTVKQGVNPLLLVGGGAIAVVLGLILIIRIIGAMLGGLQGGSLTADSTCRQFLNTDQQTEAQAIVDIAVAKGLRGYGSPLALPAVRYDCSSHPDDKLGDSIQKFKGQF